MKRTSVALFLFCSVIHSHAQGTVRFSNDSTDLSFPPDRLVRFDSTAIAFNPFGTNYAPVASNLVPGLRVQLYYGSSVASEGQLVGVTVAPTTFKPSTSPNIGTWFAGFRTLDGFYDDTVNLQVRVWDLDYASSWEAAQALGTAYQGLLGQSQIFSYRIPTGVTIPPGADSMQNFQSFTIGLVPEPSSYAVALLGGGILYLCSRKKHLFKVRTVKTTIKTLVALITLHLSVCCTLSQTNDPIEIKSHTIITNGATYFKDRTRKPPSLQSVGDGVDSPTPTTNFLSILRCSQPPDVNGAVGKDFVVTMINQGVRVQTRNGGFIKETSLQNFWTSTNLGPVDFYVGDPRIVYDPYNDRWIATAAEYFFSTNSAVLIGVSRTSNPTNFNDSGWNFRRVKTDTNSVYWADFPQLGFNKDWIVVHADTANVYSNAPYRSFFWVFNKTNLYAGGFTQPTFLLHADTTTSIASLGECPALTYDNSISTIFVLQNASGHTNVVGGTNDSGWLRMFSITGSIGSEVLNYVTNPVYIQVNATWHDSPFPTGGYRTAFEPQTNSAFKIQTSPDSRVSSVTFRNGSLWCAQTIFLPAGNPIRSSIQWWQIKPDTLELLQRGRVDDTSGLTNYAFASLAVNRFDDVLVGFNSFSSNQYASANYSFRAFNDDKNDLRSTRIFKAGETFYTDERWGDYSTTVVDPVNDADMWTIQEYAATNECEEFRTNINWGTCWSQVKVVIPTNDNFNTTLRLNSSQGSTNGTNIRATKETGEPNHTGNTNSVSVWYNWTAPADGKVVLNVNGNFDTALAVYTGGSVTNLSLIASNHGGYAGSQVVFTANADIEYEIVVDGFGASPNNQGNFTLTWNQPTAPVFTLQPGNRDLFMTSNVTFTASAIGNPTPGYQWRFNGTNISSATLSSYTKNNIQTNDTGDYKVVATNTSGSATSQVAHLQVYSSQQALITQPSFGTNKDYIRFIVSGITGAHYVVQASTNLVNWSSTFTNVTTFTNISYDLTNFPQRYYRILYQPW